MAATAGAFARQRGGVTSRCIAPSPSPLALDSLAGLDNTEREMLTGLLKRVTANLGWPPPRKR